ncbi:MAG: hypothetical protein HQ471_00340 [Flavobacteriales bacterium]|nr:hypothetical protein [Flavobacteriales bacterium]
MMAKKKLTDFRYPTDRKFFDMVVEAETEEEAIKVYNQFRKKEFKIGKL